MMKQDYSVEHHKAEHTKMHIYTHIYTHRERGTNIHMYHQKHQSP